jgi:hypothetical protein
MGQVAVRERELEVAIENVIRQVALEDTSDKQHRYQARGIARSAHRARTDTGPPSQRRVT